MGHHHRYRGGLSAQITLPHMPARVSAARDVSGSMLVTRFEFAKAIVAPPPSLGPTFLKMDIAHALTPAIVAFAFVFLFMLAFDAIGTLIGVCEQAGFMRDNKLPRAKQAMVSRCNRHNRRRSARH